MIIDQPWLANPSTQALFALLGDAGHAAYIVGGAPRNALMALPVDDLDFATSARPDTVTALAEAAGHRVVPTGLAHGTVTVVIDGTGFEVTTFRRDIETSGRHAVVAFADDIDTDARRRDFTMNALYVTGAGRVADPLGQGIADATARRVRFIDDPGQRLDEDALRILRFFRFFAWYGDPGTGIDPDGLAACAARIDALAGLSAERIGAEMKKLLAAPDPGPAVASMGAAGILAAVAPGAHAAAIPPLVAAEAGAGAAWQRRAVAMGCRSDTLDWRLSRAEVRSLDARVAALSAQLPVDQAGYRFGADAAFDAALILAAAGTPLPPDAAARAAAGASRQCPVSAADLIDRYGPGPALGAALTRLEDAWVRSSFQLDRAGLLTLDRDG